MVKGTRKVFNWHEQRRFVCLRRRGRRIASLRYDLNHVQSPTIVPSLSGRPSRLRRCGQVIASRSSIVGVMSCLLAVCAAWSCNSHADSLTVEASAFSETAYRGLSESFGHAALGIDVEWAGARGLHAGLSYREADTRPVRQRERSISTYVGWQTSFTNDWIAGTTLVHRAFPGATKEWDSFEVQAAIGWRDRLSLEVAWSPDYYSHNTEMLALTLRALQPLSRSFYASAELGTVDADWRDISRYSYGQVAIGLRRDRWLLEVSHARSTNEGENLFGERLDPPELLFEVSYLIR